jgi:two-component system, NarL family, sensor histidine kinase DesK
VLSFLQAAAVAPAISRVVMRQPWNRRVVTTWVAGSLLAYAGGAAALWGSSFEASVASTAVVLALAPLGRYRFRRYAPVVLVTVVVGALPFGVEPGSLAFYVAFGLFLTSVLQMSMWVLDVVRRLADAERDRVRLAVAEERLRFSRDLHDVVGRDLSAIAVTSDLVAELARRGRPEAVERAEEVRSIAQNSLQQIRDVVRGYRTVDLSTELEGSVALLRSAGIECTVVHAATDVPDQVATAAAWVIREGVTNVVRHSTATWCRITVERVGDVLQVRLENDGVDPTKRGHGSGLQGLSERLAAVGGTLETHRGQGTFVLDVRLEMV